MTMKEQEEAHCFKSFSVEIHILYKAGFTF